MEERFLSIITLERICQARRKVFHVNFNIIAAGLGIGEKQLSRWRKYKTPYDTLKSDEYRMLFNYIDELCAAAE